VFIFIICSKLFCYSFTSWDSKKEWCTELPAREQVIGLAAGDGWLAASSDMNRIRIFTIGGAQKQIIEIGGQIITTSGHEDLLFVTFHNGIGKNKYFLKTKKRDIEILLSDLGCNPRIIFACTVLLL